MPIIRRASHVRARSATVSGAVLVNETAWSISGTIAARRSTVSGLIAVVPYVTPYTPPSWDEVPTVSFLDGQVGQIWSYAGLLNVGTEGTPTVTVSGSLPAGVTHDAANQRLVYDGRTQPVPPGLPVTSSVQLVADDGYGNDVDVQTIIVKEPDGTAGMLFAEDDIPSGHYISFATSGTSGTWQASVKNLWPNGSVRFAVLSWSGTTASDGAPYTMTVRSSTVDPNAGAQAVSLTTLRSIVSLSGYVVLSPYGSTGLQDVIVTAPWKTWFEGPACSEWHWHVGIGSDDTLAVIWYVRLYANNQIWVRCIIENGYVFKGDTTNKQQGKQYHATITLGGIERYNSQTDASLSFSNTSYLNGAAMWYAPWVAGNMIPHFSRSRWSKEFWYNSVRTIKAPGLDGNYLIGTKLFLNYAYKNVPQSTYDSTYWKTEVVPLSNANHRPNMKDTASHPEIAYLPAWDVLYLLAQQGSANQEKMFASVVANATASNSYGFMRTESAWSGEKLRPFLWSDWPNLWIQSGDPNSVGTAIQGGPYVADDQHQPSWAFMAYCLTGDYFHLETQQAMATSFWMSPSYLDREGIKGLYWSWDRNARSHAWVMRNMAQAGLITPYSADSNSYDYKMQTCYRDCVHYNAERMKAVFIDNSLAGYAFDERNTLGWIVSNKNFNTHEYPAGGNRVTPTAQYKGSATWQHSFVCTVYAMTCSMKILTGTRQTTLETVTDFALKMPVGLCGLGNAAGWPYTLAGANVLWTWKLPNGSSTWVKPANWTEAYDWFLDGTSYNDERIGLLPLGDDWWSSCNQGGSDPCVTGGYAPDPYSAADSYWGNLQPAISFAVDRGVPGANDAWLRLTSLQSWPSFAAALESVPQWAVAPRNPPV